MDANHIIITGLREQIDRLSDNCDRYLTEIERLRKTLRLIGSDMHMTSTRPCPTCRAVSEVLGESFGCVKGSI